MGPAAVPRAFPRGGLLAFDFRHLHDADAGVGAHGGAVGAAGALVGIGETGEVEAVAVDLLLKLHGVLWAEVHTEPTALAEFLLDRENDPRFLRRCHTVVFGPGYSVPARPEARGRGAGVRGQKRP